MISTRAVSSIAIASLLLASCGGDSDETTATDPQVTLIPDTSEAPTPTTVAEDDFTAVPEPTEATTTQAESTTSAAPESTTPPDTAVPSTEAVSTTEAASVTEAPPATDPPAVGGGFVLGEDGLGAVPFGADPDQAIAFMNGAFGAPTDDTGWLEPIEIGPCGGTRIRQVYWNQLLLEFGDVSDITQGRDHLYAFFYGVEGSSTPAPPGLKTAEDIGPGSTVADLLAAYPAVTLFEGDEFIGPSFRVNDNLSGRISGTTTTDVVEAIVGGRPCDG